MKNTNVYFQAPQYIYSNKYIYEECTYKLQDKYIESS